jgi:hypothetical protein
MHYRAVLIFIAAVAACGSDPPQQSGPDAAVDATAIDALPPPSEQPPPVPDAPAEAGLDATPPPDASPDATGMDAPADAPAPDAMVDADPRASEVCRGVNATCDGRRVNVQGGERDGGITYHCGGCGITCAAGFGCDLCVCVPL